MNYIEILKQNENLSSVPEGDLDWLLTSGETIQLKKGDFIFRPNEPADHFIFIFTGGFRIYIEQQNAQREITRIMPGEITGVLPYSRLKTSTSFGQALEDSSFIQVHRSHFVEMITAHHALTEALVHHMSSRIRNLTTITMQNEKLMSLGKLSAGLAHELNNPAAAMVRSSSTLLRHLKLIPEHFKNVLSMRVDLKAVEEVSALIFEMVQRSPAALGLLERSQRENELSGVLDNCSFEGDTVETAEELVEFGITPEDLERLCGITGDKAFEPVLKWIIDNLTTERVVGEINESAVRISELIGSIKEYSHMDSVKDRQAVHINQGLKSTLRMLKHKANGKSVEIVEDFDVSIPAVMGFPGELNQVWTNLIDNAFDAMETTGGQVTIKTIFCDPFVDVYITDTGSGISEDIMSKIFDPFFTTKAMGKGTGLGLDVVNKIIMHHRARIDVNSKPGKTEFKISLPVDVQNGK